MSLFHTRVFVKQRVCRVIIDGESRANLASIEMIEKLSLPTLVHPQPYNLQGLDNGSVVEVTRQVVVLFSIGKYVDDVLCDIVPMEDCHLLLGRSWQRDRRVMHDDVKNTYSFIFLGKRLRLVPMSQEQILEDDLERKKRREAEEEKVDDDVAREEVTSELVDDDSHVKATSIIPLQVKDVAINHEDSREYVQVNSVVHEGDDDDVVVEATSGIDEDNQAACVALLQIPKDDSIVEGETASGVSEEKSEILDMHVMPLQVQEVITIKEEDKIVKVHEKMVVVAKIEEVLVDELKVSLVPMHDIRVNFLLQNLHELKFCKESHWVLNKSVEFVVGDLDEFVLNSTSAYGSVGERLEDILRWIVQDLRTNLLEEREYDAGAIPYHLFYFGREFKKIYMNEFSRFLVCGGDVSRVLALRDAKKFKDAVALFVGKYFESQDADLIQFEGGVILERSNGRTYMALRVVEEVVEELKYEKLEENLEGSALERAKSAPGRSLSATCARANLSSARASYLLFSGNFSENFSSRLRLGEARPRPGEGQSAAQGGQPNGPLRPNSVQPSGQPSSQTAASPAAHSGQPSGP